jgi:hypothetical protein
VKEEPPSEESSSEESSSDDSDDDPLDFFHLMPSKDDKGEAISIGFRDWGKRTLGQDVDELVYGAAEHRHPTAPWQLGISVICARGFAKGT